MFAVIVVILLSVADAYLTNYLIGLGLKELNVFYPLWLLTNVPIRGVIATLGAIWFYRRNWGWLLWGWTLLLASVVIWNLFILLVCKFGGW